MEKLKTLLTSKKFWTLVAAIVAALAAFFTSACTAQARIQKHGVHCDTVKIDYLIRSRPQNTLTSCNVPALKSTTTPYIGRFMRSSATSISSVNTMPRQVTISYSNSTSRILPSCPICSILSPISESPSSTTATEIYSLHVLPSVSKSVSPTSGFGCSALMMASVLFFPISRSRRGGRRKGRPRPKIKSIPLGGSHL